MGAALRRVLRTVRRFGRRAARRLRSGRRLRRPAAVTSRRLRASMLRVRQLVLKEFRQLFRDPRTKRIVFVAPVVQLVIFGYAVNTDVRDVPLFVVDHDRTAASRRLVDGLAAGGYFRVVGRSLRPDDLTRALDAGRAVIGIEVPPGFARDRSAGRGGSVQLLIDGTNSNTATIARGYAVRIIQSHGARPRGDAWRAGSQGARTAPHAAPAAGIDLRARAWYNPELRSRDYNVPAVIGVILLLMCLMLTALAVVRERELGTLEQLLVSPLSAGELMLGKTLPVAGIAFVDLALVTGVALAWFGIPLRGSLVTLLLASSIFILASLACGLLISTLSGTQQQALMVMFLFFLPAIVLSGLLYPVRTMPELFRLLTVLNPIRHFLDVVRALFLKGAGIAELWPQLAILAAMAVGALWLAVWRFRRTVG